MQVRRANEADIPRIVEIYNASLQADWHCSPAAGLEPWTCDYATRFLRRATETIVLEHQGQVVGVEGLKVKPSHPHVAWGIVCTVDPNVFVDEQERIRATRKLFRGAVQIMRQRGITELRATLSVNEPRQCIGVYLEGPHRKGQAYKNGQEAELAHDYEMNLTEADDWFNAN